MSGTDLVGRLTGTQLAAGRGGHTAYADPDAGEVSYARLHAAARRYARALDASGVRAGSRGLIVAEDSVATVVAVLGSWWHGSVPVPVSPLLPDADMDHVVRDCAPRFVYLDVRARRAGRLLRFAGGAPAVDAAAVLAAVRADAGPHETLGEEFVDDVPGPARWPDGTDALVQYTSGSTGAPKGVRHSADAITAMLAGFGSTVPLRPEDRVLATARMSFGYGFGSSVLCPLAAGATVVLIRGAVDVHSVTAAVRRHRPTVLCSVPRMYAALLDHVERRDSPDLDRGDHREGQGTREPSERRSDDAFGTLRLCLSAGENCPPELAGRIRASFAPDLVNCLGATEALHVVLAGHAGGGAVGALGHAVAGTTATVRDEEGREVSAGTRGRLHVAGPTVSLGYTGQPGTTAFADGGLYTGDVVLRHPDGSFDYVCRSDDLLMLGGHKVAPGEIESVVRAADGVGDCAVVGSDDEHGLTVAVVYVVPASGAEPDAVRRSVAAALRAGLPAYKRPSGIRLLAELPVTVTGKVAAHRLRAQSATRTR